MLWYWRCLENRNVVLNDINYYNSIGESFGIEYTKLLNDYKYFDVTKCDFLFRGRCVSELNDAEKDTLELIAEKRFYAFEWLCSEEDWDQIDLVC